MPTTPATAETPARTVDEQFLALVCNDADLLARRVRRDHRRGMARPAGGAPPRREPADRKSNLRRPRGRRSSAEAYPEHHHTPASTCGARSAHLRTWQLHTDTER